MSPLSNTNENLTAIECFKQQVGSLTGCTFNFIIIIIIINATTTFKPQIGKDIVKIVHVTSVVQP